MSVLETALASVKRDYELLRVEYERMIASNEQAGPVAKELRLTVDSLQKSINQHKSEVSRCKAKSHKLEQQLTKVGPTCDCGSRNMFPQCHTCPVPAVSHVSCSRSVTRVLCFVYCCSYRRRKKRSQLHLLSRVFQMIFPKVQIPQVGVNYWWV